MADQCKTVFDMSIHLAMTIVKEHIAAGDLTAEMVDEIENALTVNNQQSEAFCHSVHERCMRNERLDLMVPARTNAFGRIMVQERHLAPIQSLNKTLHQNLAASHSKILTQARFHTDRVKLGRPRALDFTAETPPQPDIIDYVCRRADV